MRLHRLKTGADEVARRLGIRPNNERGCRIASIAAPGAISLAAPGE